jgi:hypothetical protein
LALRTGVESQEQLSPPGQGGRPFGCRATLPRSNAFNRFDDKRSRSHLTPCIHRFNTGVSNRKTNAAPNPIHNINWNRFA